MIAQRLAELIIGDSLAIRRVRDTIIKIAPSRLPVLIHGPTGAGKELVARGIHLASGRSGEFVAFNVCALSESLFESALFGHVRGAFTGAVEDLHGHLADANGGTVFLDEIGGLPLASQPKLLRVLDGHAFRPVGAPRDRASDFRAVAATNDDLRVMVQTGRFRADLFHRLSGISVRVPPLSARLEDVPALAAYFLARLGQRDEGVRISADGISSLQRYAWPGNVRELAHVLERAMLFASARVIEAIDIAAALDSPARLSPPPSLDSDSRDRLVAALAATRGDTGAAARLLGMSRPTIYRQLRVLGVAARQWRALSPLDPEDILAAPSHDSHENSR